MENDELDRLEAEAKKDNPHIVPSEIRKLIQYIRELRQLVEEEIKARD